MPERLILAVSRFLPGSTSFSQSWLNCAASVAGVFGGSSLSLGTARSALSRNAADQWSHSTGYLKQKFRWEFWPAWAVYLPLVPYLLWLGWRHRSLTLFTAANPGIETGGLAGESKSQILSKLRSSGRVAEFTVLFASNSLPERLELARGFLRQSEFPVVLKPDVGERGDGVAIIRSYPELVRQISETRETCILQRYVPGVEFGVFYQRHPGEAQGRIDSITRKVFPTVTGDGTKTLRELICQDRRAASIAQVYQRSLRRPWTDVPKAGETVPLGEIGSHCRGVIFLNGVQLWTPELENAVDRVSKAHAGFFLGRYDVRAASEEAFRRGEFQVIELNGVSSEPTHIYDPSVPIADAYRALAGQWRGAFEIGAYHRANGIKPTSVRELARVVWQHLCSPSPQPTQHLSESARDRSTT